MTVPVSIAAYDREEELFDKALKSPHGVRAHVASYGDGVQLRTRLNYLRKLLRERSMEQYPPDSPDYNISGYDTLVVREPTQEGDKWWVKIESRGIVRGVEELGAAE